MPTKRPKRPKRPIDILTPLEVRQLIAQCSKRAPTGARDAALIATLYRGGLRRGEVVALKARDLNSERGTIRIHDGKGHKPRTIGIDATAFGLIDRWLRKKEELELDPRTTPLFCTLQGKALWPENIGNMLKRRAAKAGIDKRVHPHGLRHTHAMELIADEKIPLNALQKQLGHANLLTTSIYVNHLGSEEVVEIGRRRAVW